MNTISSQMPLAKTVEVSPVKVAPEVRDELQAREEIGPEAPEEEKAAVRTDELEKLVAMIQEHLNRLDINVRFSTYGEERKRTAVIVSERDTGEIIREFPPEELQKLHVKMDELIGMIFNGEA